MNFSRRVFLKSFVNYSVAFSLSIAVSNLTFNNNMQFISEKFYLMGTQGKIQVFVNNIDYGTSIVRQAINRIKYLEVLLTKFSPESDIGIINSYPDIYSTVSDNTIFVLTSGMILSNMTFGYFDMGLGNILSSYGIDENIPLVGKKTSLNDISGDLLSISEKNRVKLKRKNVMLDLGGIAKGYALDEAMDVFLNAGIKHVAIEFGGDVKVNSGMPSGLPWTIMLDNKLSGFFDIESRSINMYTGSLAVSGGYFKRSPFFPMCHHIIDIKSLKSKNNYFIVIVSGKDSMICDALSTACYNMDVNLLNKVSDLFNGYNIRRYL